MCIYIYRVRPYSPINGMHSYDALLPGLILYHTLLKLGGTIPISYGGGGGGGGGGVNGVC
jgi:hypothetical protein